MTRRKRRSSRESSSAPKSPRLREDAKIDSAAAARRSSPATDGPHICAASIQVHHPPQPPSIPTPRTPQREVRGPAATACVVHRVATWAAPRPPPPSSALTTVRDPLNPRQLAAAAETLSSSAALTCTPPSLQDGSYCPPSTPPPARAPTPSPSTSIGTSGMPYSFADAVKRGTNQSPDDKRRGNQSPDDNLITQRFYEYLKNMPKKTANNSTKGQIITATQTVIWVLKIDEQHLDEHDSELAYAVFHSQDRFKEALYRAVSQYLISEGIVNNAVGGMNGSFSIMPSSTKTLEDFLREQESLVSMKSIFDGNFELCVASDIGMMLVHGFLVYILDIHKQGRTWNGGFSTGDMVVENCLKCRITKVSKQGISHCRAADLHKIAEIFKPMFTINEEMALYFDVLQKDLQEASNVEVEAKWYREYLVSHPALKSSIARYNLECGLHHAAASFRSKDGLVRSILRKHNRWKELIPHETTEGTPDTVLYEVFYYKHDLSKGLDPPYPSTVGGLLSYKRNLLQHGDEYIKVMDHSELEQFAAKTFSPALPNIVRELLSHREMNGLFKDHWEAYCSSRVGNDGNSEGRTGVFHFEKM